MHGLKICTELKDGVNESINESVIQWFEHIEKVERINNKESIGHHQVGRPCKSCIKFECWASKGNDEWRK